MYKHTYIYIYIILEDSSNSPSLKRYDQAIIESKTVDGRIMEVLRDRHGDGSCDLNIKA